jgi:hypothetical protein
MNELFEIQKSQFASCSLFNLSHLPLLFHPARSNSLVSFSHSDKLRAIPYHGPHRIIEFCEKFREIELQIVGMDLYDAELFSRIIQDVSLWDQSG